MHTAIIKIFSINIIAAISWPPPLISQLFSPRLLRATRVTKLTHVPVRAFSDGAYPY